MHILEGMLSPAIYIVFIILALGFIALAFRWTVMNFSYSNVLLLVTSALVVMTFQMLDFPLPDGASGSFVGSAFLGIVLGAWPGFLTYCVITFIQSQLFVDGGVSTMAANMVCIGLVGSFVGSSLFKLIGKGNNLGLKVLGAATGSFVAVFAIAFAVSSVVALSGSAPFGSLLSGVFSLCWIVAIVDAIVTAILIGYIAIVKPQLFETGVTLTRAEVNVPVALTFFIISIIAAICSFLASPNPEILAAVYESVGTVPVFEGAVLPAPAEGYYLEFLPEPTSARIGAGFLAIVMVGLWLWTMTSGMTKPRPPRGKKNKGGRDADDLPEDPVLEA